MEDNRKSVKIEKIKNEDEERKDEGDEEKAEQKERHSAFFDVLVLNFMSTNTNA